MPTTVSISANIPEDLSDMLNKVSRAEERSKSYYIKKGLEQFLRDRLENLEDYEDTKKAYDEFVTSGEKAVPMDEVFRNVR
ncbi:MAG: ribbon-helix-helix domain-containing protein [Rhizobiaceae bacterium]|nr:ribbon-helix-helix domain-containing protein [Rhizobiaceae bacterium]